MHVHEVYKGKTLPKCGSCWHDSYVSTLFSAKIISGIFEAKCNYLTQSTSVLLIKNTRWIGFYDSKSEKTKQKQKVLQISHQQCERENIELNRANLHCFHHGRNERGGEEREACAYT